MPTIAIMGASRGIGLGLAREYAGAGWAVHATVRDPAAPGELAAIREEAAGDVHIHRLDVRNDDDIAALAAELAGTPLDVLIHNAGMTGSRGAADAETTALTMRVNAEAPILTAEALLPSVAAGGEGGRGGKIALMSSVMGSGRPHPGSPHLYGDSKAALNRRFREVEPAWRARGVVAIALHPGYVRTDMTGHSAAIDVAESAAGIRRTIDALGPADSGRFLDYTGKEIAW